jgi:hypothetical protein
MISMVHCAHIRIEQCVYYSDLNSGLVVLKWYACRVGFDGFQLFTRTVQPTVFTLYSGHP